MKSLLRLLALTSLLFLSTLNLGHAFEIFEGEIHEFTGPDDLLLDPGRAVIAVDFFGNADSVINGVTFSTDRAGLGANVTGEGVVTVGAVTATIVATNTIDNWANSGGGVPGFTGADATSATNLANVMRDIRFSGAPNPVTIDITGLTPNFSYDVQLLFNEGQNTNDRRHDIAIGGTLVVDDSSSHGGVFGSWTDSNSFSYQVESDSGADGTLNIVLVQDFGGIGPQAVDNNPIIQGLILHTAAPPAPPTDILLSDTVFLASVPIGTTVGALSSVDINGGTHTYTLAAGAGDTHNSMFDVDGTDLNTNADFSTMPGQTFSIRIRSTDEENLTFEKTFDLMTSADSDNDGLLDSWEAMFTANPDDLTGLEIGPGPGQGTGDFDDDGVSDIDEFGNGTDPTDDDSDDDGLTDGGEVAEGTDPNDDDSDDDGLLDGEEITLGTNPLEGDSDGDTLSDADEVNGNNPHNWVTDPLSADSDGDGFSDGVEVATGPPGADPNNPNLPESATVFFKEGGVVEFKGPDDLHLDPSTVVIAVDVNGNADSVINGVTFLTDTQGGTSGSATQDGVTVTSSAANQINDWAGGPAFTGADPASAASLSEVMRDIRWEAAPNPLTIDVEGLIPGAAYEIQLLFNEGADRARHWDIAVEDELAVDNITSEGLAEQVWAPDNSFSCVLLCLGPADGVLDIDMQRDIPGGQPTMGTDNNPILQGIIIHEDSLPIPFAVTDITYNSGKSPTVDLVWNSRPGRLYAVWTSTDLETWFEIDDGISSQGDSTSYQVFGVNPSETKRFYHIREVPTN